MNISKGRSYFFVFVICGICFFEYVEATTDFVDENTNTTLPVGMQSNILENNAGTIVQNDNGTTIKQKNSTSIENETLFEKLIIQPNGLPIRSALSVIPLDDKKKTISENEIHSAAFPSTNSSQKSENTTMERWTLADFSHADVYKQFGLNNQEISKNVAMSIASAGEYVQDFMQPEKNSRPETLNNIIRDENVNASSPIFTDIENEAPSTDRYEQMTIGISLTNEENFVAPVKIASEVNAPEEVISLKSSNENSSHIKNSTLLGYGRSMSLSNLANIDRSAEGISRGQSNQSAEFNSLNIRNGYLGSGAAENKLEQDLHALRYPEMLTDLSDVSINIEENEPKYNNMHYNGRNPEEYENTENATAFNLLKIAEKPIFTTTSENKECIENQKKYKNGETLDRECVERCTCNRGEWICEQRCSGNYVIHGFTFEKQGCHLIPSDDECCAFIECIQVVGSNSTFLNDTNTLTTSIVEVPSECNFNGAIYKFRERLEIGCDEICHCDYGGRMNCQPRCAGRNHTKLEKCVLVKDPKDICCQLELCDVTLDDHEQTPSPLTHLPSKENSISLVEDAKPEKRSCFYNDANYNISQQFYNGCDSLCICTQEGIHCAKLDCPSTFGLDVLDPHCLRWEPVPASFRPIVPKCCPERMRCVDNGTCVYEGLKFDNWSPIPSNLTGCDQHCYCENGKVECQPSCPPVLALPPSDLPCHQSLAKLIPTPDDNCCKHWGCNSLNTTINTEYSNSKELSHDNLRSELEVITMEAIDASSARVIFKVPQTYVNLHGRVELRYTNNNNNDTSSWEAQIFAPPEDLIATSQLEFELPNLESNSLYKVKIKLILRDLNVQPSSAIYTVKIPAERTITPPSLVSDYRPDFNDVLISIEDPKLTIKQTNATWLEISWRKFTDDELEFVDGLELRYKELSEKNYTSSLPIHRKLTSHLVGNLQPDTGYEIGLYFIPFSGHGTDLIAGDTIRARTASMSNAFAFVVNITVSKIKSTSVEVSWNGVPYPEDKFVNIYRAVYQSDSGKENSSIFKNTRQDLNTTTIISNLKPGTKYRIWLEMYLVNGNIKKSNMLSFITKPGSTHLEVDSGKLSTAGVSSTHIGDYYGPLVVVSVIAVLALMSTLVLLLMLTRKRVHQTASITPPSKDNAAYDNPSYKVEIQHETMNL